MLTDHPASETSRIPASPETPASSETSASSESSKAPETPASSASSRLPGRVVSPLDDYDEVSSPYGWRVHPIRGTRRFHRGTDLAADAGTPVRAIADGAVITASYPDQGKLTSERLEGYGNHIVLEHARGIRSTYAHLQRGDVAEGDHVEAGDVIGLVGSTGASTGPHLHLELTDAEAGDPEQRHTVDPEDPRYLGRVLPKRWEGDDPGDASR